MTNKGGPETEDQARIRFQIELEFVQCLGNPHYLNFLAQRGYFKDSSFVNYLKYLLYWKEPDYVKYIKYPMCLYFLDLLQYEHFRREIVNAQCAKFIDDQILLLWQHYTRRRTKLLQTAIESHSTAINASCPTNLNEMRMGCEINMHINFQVRKLINMIIININIGKLLLIEKNIQLKIVNFTYQ